MSVETRNRLGRPRKHASRRDAVSACFQAWRQRQIVKGNCAECGRRPARADRRNCMPCAKRKSARDRARYAEKKQGRERIVREAETYASEENGEGRG